MSTNNGYIKLWRKAEISELWNDQNAWRVFQWLLWNVDYETGKNTFGRKQIAAGTGIKESTVYKVTTRLHEKYQVIAMKSNKLFTEISVINWAKYQQDKKEVAGISNEKEHVTVTKSNTYKEVKNNNITPIIPLKEEKKTSKNSHSPCSDEEIGEIAKALNVSVSDVRRIHETIKDKITEGTFQKKYKTTYYTLRQWVRMGIERGTIQEIKPSQSIAESMGYQNYDESKRKGLIW